MTTADQLDELARGLRRSEHMGKDLAHHALLDADPLEQWERSLALRQELKQLAKLVDELECHYCMASATPLARELGILHAIAGGSP